MHVEEANAPGATVTEGAEKGEEEEVDPALNIERNRKEKRREDGENDEDDVRRENIGRGEDTRELDDSALSNIIEV